MTKYRTISTWTKKQIILKELNLSSRLTKLGYNTSKIKWTKLIKYSNITNDLNFLSNRITNIICDLLP